MRYVYLKPFERVKIIGVGRLKTQTFLVYADKVGDLIFQKENNTYKGVKKKDD